MYLRCSYHHCGTLLASRLFYAVFVCALLLQPTLNSESSVVHWFFCIMLFNCNQITHPVSFSNVMYSLNMPLHPKLHFVEWFIPSRLDSTHTRLCHSFYSALPLRDSKICSLTYPCLLPEELTQIPRLLCKPRAALTFTFCILKSSSEWFAVRDFPFLLFVHFNYKCLSSGSTTIYG